MSSPGPMPTTHTRVATRPASSSSTLTRWPTRRCRSPLATAAPGGHGHLEAVVEQGRARAVGLDAVDGGLHARKASVREGRAAVRAEPEAHRGGQRGGVVDVDPQARQVEVEPHVAEPLVRGGAAGPKAVRTEPAPVAGRVSSAVPSSSASGEHGCRVLARRRQRGAAPRRRAGPGGRRARRRPGVAPAVAGGIHPGGDGARRGPRPGSATTA